MLGNEEQDEIRQCVYSELARIEHQISHDAGSYSFLVNILGHPTFAHSACGPVLRYIPPRTRTLND